MTALQILVIIKKDDFDKVIIPIMGRLVLITDKLNLPFFFIF
jgi:hypothetical protein